MSLMGFTVRFEIIDALTGFQFSVNILAKKRVASGETGIFVIQMNNRYNQQSQPRGPSQLPPPIHGSFVGGSKPPGSFK
jgi:hypothetical protein